MLCWSVLTAHLAHAAVVSSTADIEEWCAAVRQIYSETMHPINARNASVLLKVQLFVFSIFFGDTIVHCAFACAVFK